MIKLNFRRSLNPSQHVFLELLTNAYNINIFVLLISLMCIANAKAYDGFAHFIHNIFSTIEWLIYIGGTLIFITTMGSNI